MDNQFDVNALAEKAPVVKQIAAGEEVVWVNPNPSGNTAIEYPFSTNFLKYSAQFSIPLVIG